MPEPTDPMAETETPEVEVEIEVPMEQDAEAAPMVEPAAETSTPAETEAAPAAPAIDHGALLAASEGALTAATAERDALVGRLASVQAELAGALSRLSLVDAEMGQMLDKLARYELGAALADQGLPNQAAALVSSLYATARGGGVKTPGIRDWLAAAMTDPAHPASGLALMRSAGAVDPSANPPVDTRASALTPFPRIGAAR